MSSVEPASAVWSRVIANLDQDPREGLNTARECCERYATDRGRVALVVRHPDGRSERWTYFELAREAARASRMFASMGLRRGDRVAAVVSRTVEAWICALAAWRSGLVYVPLFYGFGSEALLARLRPAEAKALIVDHRWRGAVEDARGALADDLQIVTITGPRGTGLVRGDRSFWAEMERSAPDGPAAATAAGDVATMLFTSGTASAPKGCLMPHSGFVSLIPFVQHCFGLGRGDLLFATSDPGWAYGLYTCGAVPMALGIPRVIHSGDFDPAEWLRTIEAEQVTYIAAAPVRLPPGGRPGAALWHAELPARSDQRGRAARRRHGRGLARGHRHRDPRRLRPQRGRHGAGQPRRFRGTGRAGRAGVRRAGLRRRARRVRRHTCAATARRASSRSAGRRSSSHRATTTMPRPGTRAGWTICSSPRTWRGATSRVGGGSPGAPTTSSSRPATTSGPSRSSPCCSSIPASPRRRPWPPRIATAGRWCARWSCARPARRRATTLTKELQDAVRGRVGRHAYPRIVEYVDALPRTETGKLRRAELRRQPQTTSA